MTPNVAERTATTTTAVNMPAATNKPCKDWYHGTELLRRKRTFCNEIELIYLTVVLVPVVVEDEFTAD